MTFQPWPPYSSLVALSITFGSLRLAAAQVRPPPYTLFPRAALAQSHSWMPSRAAALVGLDSLANRALPIGVLELRLEIDCSLCTPFYLVRLIRDVAGEVSGEGYVFWSNIEPGEASDTAQQRLARHYAAWLSEQSTALGCKEIVAATDPDYIYCRVAIAIEWRQLLGNLDSLGLTAIGADTGYAPRPPAPGRRDLGCNDIAGQAAVIEVLDGSTYRNAFLWCLERPGPSGTEHWRVSQALALILGIVQSPN